MILATYSDLAARISLDRFQKCPIMIIQRDVVEQRTIGVFQRKPDRAILHLNPMAMLLQPINDTRHQTG